MRILVDGDSKEILGASLLGTGCDEAVHAILDLMYAKGTYTVMQHADAHSSDGQRAATDYLRLTQIGWLQPGPVPTNNIAGASLSFNRSRPMAVTTPGS